MEKEMLKKICKKYCKREKYIILLYRICETNKINNIIYYIEEFLKQSVSK